MKGKTGENLLILLERRLDSVAYKLGFAPTRRESRQIVRHGHFLVNGKKVNIPSFLVRSGTFSNCAKKSRKIPNVNESLDAVVRKGIPPWLELGARQFPREDQDPAVPGGHPGADPGTVDRRALLEVGPFGARRRGRMFQRNWKQMIKPRRIEVQTDTATFNYGKFVAEPSSGASEPPSETPFAGSSSPPCRAVRSPRSASRECSTNSPR